MLPDLVEGAAKMRDPDHVADHDAVAPDVPAELTQVQEDAGRLAGLALLDEGPRLQDCKAREVHAVQQTRRGHVDALLPLVRIARSRAARAAAQLVDRDAVSFD